MNDVLWPVVGFLVGVVIWMPFLLKVRMEMALEKLRAEITRELTQLEHQEMT